MNIDRRLVYAFIAGIALAWWINSGAAPTPSPFHPFGPPAPQRPVMQFLARIAKTFLWVALVAEAPPTAPAGIVHGRIYDGHPTIDHGRAF
jgi:hypothetical protein